MSEEPSSLAKEVESLRTILEEKEEDLKRAAECGLHLMEVNKELEIRLERDTKESTEQLDVRICRNTSFFLSALIPSLLIPFSL